MTFIQILQTVLDFLDNNPPAAAIATLAAGYLAMKAIGSATTVRITGSSSAFRSTSR